MRWKIRLKVGSPKNGDYVEVYKFKRRCQSLIHTDLSCFNFFRSQIQQRLRFRANMEILKAPKMAMLLYTSITNFIIFPMLGDY